MITREALEEIIQKKPTIFILGAGLSTDSGIDDFKHLQSKHNIVGLLSAESYRQKYWQQHDFISDYLMVKAVPNPAHYWLAKLSHLDTVRLINQNIDSLLEEAGIRREHILNIHGSLKKFIDQDRRPVNISQDEYKQMTEETGTRNNVRPDIVLYGEQVREFPKAISWADQAEVIVIIGTRLNVFPVNQLALSGQNMEHMIIINLDHLNIESTKNVTVDQINMPISAWLNS